jgi:hypothetical protein
LPNFAIREFLLLCVINLELDVFLSWYGRSARDPQQCTGEHFKPGAARPSSQSPSPVRFAFPDTNEQRSWSLSTLVRRREAVCSKAIWQADHTPLDIELLQSDVDSAMKTREAAIRPNKRVLNSE